VTYALIIHYVLCPTLSFFPCTNTDLEETFASALKWLILLANFRSSSAVMFHPAFWLIQNLFDKAKPCIIRAPPELPQVSEWKSFILTTSCVWSHSKQGETLRPPRRTSRGYKQWQSESVLKRNFATFCNINLNIYPSRPVHFGQSARSSPC
jgi:hypothetical protein